MRERQLDSEFRPEGNQETRSVNVRIERPETIFKSLEGGTHGEIAYEFLEHPIQEVGINIYPNKKTFDLVARTKLSDNFDASKFMAAMLDQYSACYREKGKNFIIPHGNSRFVVTLRSGNTLWISSGVAERYFGPEDGAGKRGPNFPVANVISSPPLTGKNFESTMRDFTSFLSETYTHIYARSGKIPPSQEIVISPTDEMAGRCNETNEGSEDEGILNRFTIERPTISFDEVGGQQEAKNEIESLAFAFKNPQLYEKWGTKIPKGVLLYGPPGTGKTLMAKALASQADANFLYIQASDVTSKWYGESEKIVARIFSEARKSKENTILYIDEVDALMPNRDGQTHEATNRMMSVFLQNIDGLNASNNLMVVASTNRLSSMDPAILRSGRFDRQINVPLPDRDGAIQILQIHIDKAEARAGRILFGQVDIDRIIGMLDGMSGADIAELVRRVLEGKVRLEGSTGQDPGMVTTENMEQELVSFEHKDRTTKRQLGFLQKTA